MSERFKFDSLNTSYVNLAALIRYLREKEFTGRLHVALDQYETDVFLYGSEEPSVWENDRAAGREAQGEAAMQRLLVRAREPGGVITVYEGLEPASSTNAESVGVNISITDEVVREVKKSENDLALLIPLSGEVIAAVERAVASTGLSFAQQFHLARIEIGDDYPFLDPTVGGFEYADSKVKLQSRPSTYVQGVTESLKRVVNRVAQQQDESSFRERVAVELAVAFRRQPNGLQEFTKQLDRIAGTRVL